MTWSNSRSWSGITAPSQGSSTVSDREAIVAAGLPPIRLLVAESAGVVLRVSTDVPAALFRPAAEEVLVVWRLDRLCRSLPHLIETHQIGSAR